MADIFLSYAREDEPRARLLAAALESRRWSVWWDRRIPHGKDFNAYIQHELDAARCIVVLWSKASLASPFVRDEASEGLDGRLVPTLIESVKQPLGFRQLQAADLSDWDGGFHHDEFERLGRSISAIVPPSRDAAPVQPRQALPTFEHASAEPSPSAQAPAATHALFEPTRDRSSSPSGQSADGPATAVRAERHGFFNPVRAVALIALSVVVALAIAFWSRSSVDPSAWRLPGDDLLGFVEIPAGSFTMGSDRSRDREAQDNELPQHQVTLPAFLIGRYEVTVGQYEACANDGACKPGERRALIGASDAPVRSVSWDEALAYCGWLEAKLKSWKAGPRKLADVLAGRRDGRPWRVTLPSEAEWEAAARGTDGRIYPWGDRIDPSKVNYVSAGRGAPTPVGSFPYGASPYGLLDVSGNVWEWTRSQDAPYPYRPDDGRENIKAGDDVRRVKRGGSFYVGAQDVRTARRLGDNVDFRTDDIGFRVVVSPFP
jgi:formylglycine-generating enzyme required for sulfatase activity